jgi:hypothetical protein
MERLLLWYCPKLERAQVFQDPLPWRQGLPPLKIKLLDLPLLGFGITLLSQVCDVSLICPKLRGWRVRHAFPSRLMVLTCVMLSLHTAHCLSQDYQLSYTRVRSPSMVDIPGKNMFDGVLFDQGLYDPDPLPVPGRVSLVAAGSSSRVAST